MAAVARETWMGGTFARRDRLRRANVRTLMKASRATRQNDPTRAKYSTLVTVRDATQQNRISKARFRSLLTGAAGQGTEEACWAEMDMDHTKSRRPIAPIKYGVGGRQRGVGSAR